MESIFKRIQEGEILVADGAMGTMLLERGLKPGESPEQFNLTRPEVLAEIARLYFNAGADIVQTNTFGGSPMKLEEYGLDDQAEEINRIAAQIVKEQIGNNAYASGSCGPSGKMLQPYGDSTYEELFEGFKRQITGLIAGGVDLICVETMTDLQEAVAAIKAAKAVIAENSEVMNIPVMATMTFDENPKGFYTMMGVSVAEAAKGLKDAGAQIIGSNCGNGIEKMVKIAREFRKHTPLPILIQSNAGIPQSEAGKLVYSETAEFFAEKTLELAEAGVSIIGGCCGTTPEYTKAIRQAVDSRKNS